MKLKDELRLLLEKEDLKWKQKGPRKIGSNVGIEILSTFMHVPLFVAKGT